MMRVSVIEQFTNFVGSECACVRGAAKGVRLSLELRPPAWTYRSCGPNFATRAQFSSTRGNDPVRYYSGRLRITAKEVPEGHQAFDAVTNQFECGKHRHS